MKYILNMFIVIMSSIIAVFATLGICFYHNIPISFPITLNQAYWFLPIVLTIKAFILFILIYNPNETISK